MAADDLYQALPTPDLQPDDLGVPALPPPPVVPPSAAPDVSKQQSLLNLGVLGLLLGAGTRVNGLAQGVLAGQRQLQQDRESRRIRDEAAQQKADAAYAIQERQYQQLLAGRQQKFQSAIQSLRTQMASVKDKATYDTQIEGFANLLQASGYRINANQLRVMVPFVAPTSEKNAQEAIALWQKNPANAEILKTNPQQAATAMVEFDRDGDGVPERVSLKDLAVIARMPFAEGPDGLMFSPAGTTADLKANADGILQSLLAKDKAEGKADTPERRIELQKQAIAAAADAKPSTTDPTLQAIREVQLQNLKNAPALPPAVQRRVDTKAKAFDTQPAVKRTQIMAEAVAFVNSLDPNTTNPADDQALIYAFAKAMDPESVVREGEYATVQKYAQSWAETFGFNAARIFSNTAFLTPQARANMKATIQKRFAAGKAQYDNLRSSYINQINRITGSGDGESYLTDYGAAFPDGGGAPAPTPTTPTATPRDYGDYLRMQGKQ